MVTCGQGTGADEASGLIQGGKQAAQAGAQKADCKLGIHFDRINWLYAEEGFSTLFNFYMSCAWKVTSTANPGLTILLSVDWRSLIELTPIHTSLMSGGKPGCNETMQISKNMQGQWAG